ncbi:thiamine phosphate synthase [Ferrovum sp.]|jgi:thiamine-phosphate pyrophosphorylase|uniref:thiamine phosphate synthase n=1 Tax=Ferrovum sp. TaxID=2609467 RepID=UPI002620E2A5|nr:thiamine phosphate synthase [Ferrovum sp.]
MSIESSGIRGLYGITPELSDTADLLRRVRLAFLGGMSVLQYRVKSLDISLRQTQLAQLRALCDEFGAPLILNDGGYPAWAGGVHVGREDARPEEWPRLARRGLLGVSCYADLDRALAAEAAGAAYVALGRFFPSPTKPEAAPVTLEILRASRARLRVPIVAIGGITPDRVAGLRAAGADAVAVLSGLFDAPDIMGRAREYAANFE